jgi:aspartyl-tRNA(Asn)/glutamyl-tRNA(Gln) amidotransferase subunit A
MVSLGKTNMDEFAMGSSNETSFLVRSGIRGTVRAFPAARPVAPPRRCRAPGPGGDRYRYRRLDSPAAALCNLTGLKPTYGVVSRYGMIAFASSLDQGGPMAASAEDCALLLNTMVGFDERDSTSLNRPVEDYARDLDKPLNGLRIGLPKEFFGEGCDAEVMAAVRAAIAEYEKLGASCVECRCPIRTCRFPLTTLSHRPKPVRT